VFVHLENLAVVAEADNLLVIYNMNTNNGSQYFDNKELFLGPKVTQYGSHMVMTQVQKETKKKYWNIDTQFRDDYDTSANYLTQYNFSLPQPINDVKSIYVNSVELPITYYNISSSLGNNVFKITNVCTEVNLLTCSINYTWNVTLSSYSCSINLPYVRT
jgi:hypothetical protein